MLATCEILQCFPVLWPWLVKWLLTNRFHVAEHLSSNRSQMTSKYGKNKKVAHAVLSVSLMFLPHFDVFCDLHVLLNRCMATWNLLGFFYIIRKQRRMLMMPSVPLSSNRSKVRTNQNAKII